MKVKKSKIVMSGTSIISRVFMIEKVPGKSIDELVQEAIMSKLTTRFL